MWGVKKEIFFLLLRLDREPAGTNQSHFTEWICSIAFSLVVIHTCAKAY